MLFLLALTAAVLLNGQAGAQYIQQGDKLCGTGATPAAIPADQGCSVSISADGNTAIVGGFGDSSNHGAAWVFTRTGNTWSRQAQKLVGTRAVGEACQGWSAAISADGNFAIVGGPGDSSNVGAAWVFTRNGTIWSQEGEKLVGAGAIGMARQGTSVSISSDGETAIVGGPTDSAATGAAWIFTRHEGVWTQEGNKLVGAGFVGTACQGVSVALSSDGNTAIIGGSVDNADTGAAWIFTRIGGAWKQQGNKLVGMDCVLRPEQGTSVSLSSDGNTAIIGGPHDNDVAGAAWIFTRNDGEWSQAGSKLVVSGSQPGGYRCVRLGKSVSLSADGKTAMMGGAWDISTTGAAWVFTLSGEGWRQQGDKIVCTNAIKNGWEGCSVALSADGNTAIVGECNSNSIEGAAWVFLRTDSVWTEQGNRLQATFPWGNAGQGSAAALSADGNTAIIGGPADSSSVGAVWIFLRSGGLWRQQGNKIVGEGAAGAAEQGHSVALSVDGNTALVGGSADSAGVGAAWVFTRTDDVWSQEGAKLMGAGAVGPARQGSSVALSADGNTAILGGPGDSNGVGAAWIFTRENGVWSQQGTKHIGRPCQTPNEGSSCAGSAVALSADGNTALVAEPLCFDVGGAQVLTRNGTEWSKQQWLGDIPVIPDPRIGSSVSLSADGHTAILGAPDKARSSGAVLFFTRTDDVWGSAHWVFGMGTGSIPPVFGASVSLSRNGNTAVVGAPNSDNFVGATWVLNRTDTVWKPVAKLVGKGGAPGNQGQGATVSISADAKTVLVGGPSDNGSAGAAWVFVLDTMDFAEQTGAHPVRPNLEQNYPNPFNPSSEIRYQISELRHVKLAVYDFLGREVAVLVDERKAPGTYEVTFNGSTLASGVYFYRLQAGSFVETKKLLLVR